MSFSLLSINLKSLPGLQPRYANTLANELALFTYADLLHFYPTKYVDRSRFYCIRDLSPDMPYIQIKGYIRDFKIEGKGRKQRLVASFYDSTGGIELIWFRAFQQIQKLYELGREYIVFGKPSYFQRNISLVHPEIDPIERGNDISGGLVPIYSLKESKVSSRLLRSYLKTLIKLVEGELYESLSPDIIAKSNLIGYAEAIKQIHFPDSTEQLERARQRLKVEELLLIQIKLQQKKQQRKGSYLGIPLPHIGMVFNNFYHNHLPFTLTEAQKRVLREIRKDVLSGQQMNRLIQGDVGSGKTIVALLAMLMAIDNGYQACLMAPTEILARQHFLSLLDLLKPLGIDIQLLIGSTPARERMSILSGLSSGSISIVIGTHALIEENVQFKELAMVIIDEQHRFGVAQRSRLWSKTSNTLPHVLIMSATPIPRTLAMTLYGDLDVSIIDELPPGRKPIETYHHSQSRMYEVFDFMRRLLSSGKQAYVVFPLIEENEALDLTALEDGIERYKSTFPEYRISHVHGKMKAKEKDEHMQNFVSGYTQILLATTVIEVGVNVPNACLMVIEGADRFGLAQLHQLRGRVGRGSGQSYCILVTKEQISNDARRRIDIMCETNDGFLIAEEDMRIRGFGEMDGTKQSGKGLTLRLSNLTKDGALVSYTRNLAEYILDKDPLLEFEEHQGLVRRMLESSQTDINWGAIS